MTDYIFCPLCGCSDWSVSKIGQAATGKLTDYNCGDCGNFQYTNITQEVNHFFQTHITQVNKYSEVVKVKPYYIAIFWPQGNCTAVTTIRDLTTLRLLLSVKKIINFNWYKQEEVIEKVKKYLVFS